MRTVVCDGCGDHLFLGETAKVKDRCMCLSCTEKAVEAKEAAWTDVTRNSDLTVCFHCKKDNGEKDFEPVAGLGACPQCTAWMRNRPFPQWVTMAFVGMALAVVAAGMLNWRFVDAYLDVKACRAAAGNDLGRAALLAEQAAKNVPESRDVKILAHFYKACDLLHRDKSSEAYAEFAICCQMEPTEKLFQSGLQEAARGKAFDEKDYDEFLRLTIAYNTQPGTRYVAARLTSAYACKYAASHDEQYKVKAMECLAQAKGEWEPKDPETYDQFADRMMHRMETGQIIRKSEFMEQYPKGYEAGKEKKS
jgi:hypothetical protein